MSRQEVLLLAQEVETLCFRKGSLRARDVKGRDTEANLGFGVYRPVSTKPARGKDPGKETE